MKTNYLLFLIFNLPLFARAQEQYAVSEIPTSLLKNAHTVVRDYTMTFEVVDIGLSRSIEQKTVTILDKEGAYAADLSFSYGKLFPIDDISAQVFDAQGKKVKSLKKKDISDEKGLDYFVNDYRTKSLKLFGDDYPYTIQYTVENHTVGTFFYPEFSPQARPDQAVQFAKLQVVSSVPYRYKEVNIPEGTQISKDTWVFSHISAFKIDPLSPIGYNPSPLINLAPTKFRFGGIDGDMTTWKGLGAFIWNLNQSQKDLPEATIQKMKVLVADCPDQLCKAQKVYAYLQDNTRYYYVGLGIGGWQPAPASHVDANKYGDCKGLSNYAVAMLNAVGVPAYTALIQATSELRNSQYADFANPQFNHMIACVPLPNDTIWLECTSQTECFGYLGDFTDSRLALVATPDGGQLWRTTAYSPSTNSVKRYTSIHLNDDGSANIHSSGVYSGQQKDQYSPLVELHEQEGKRFLYAHLPTHDFEIRQFKLNQSRQRIPSIELDLDLDIKKAATKSGTRLFVPFNFLLDQMEIPEQIVERKAQIQADPTGYVISDTIYLSLPNGYTIENTLSPVTIHSSFGQYELSTSMQANQLVISRSLMIHPNIQEKDKFEELTSFLKTIRKADQSKIVLSNRT